MENCVKSTVTSATEALAMQDRLDSWKAIADYLKRSTRTVQRWECEEGLPVHRLQHDKLGSVYAFRPELDRWWSERGTQLPEVSQSKPQSEPTVAVLPFADMSQEKDQAYFCDGIAEEIINSLSRIKSLHVTSRTSSFKFRTSGADSREIARKLHVGNLLEGSVRKSGDRLRIAVQLISAENAYQLWAARYDREMKDIFAIQDEIAIAVAQALEVHLGGNGEPAPCRPTTKSIRAYDLYLRGRAYYYQYNPRSIEFALQLFLRAIELDSGFARAYAGLADCWSYLYLYSTRSEKVREQADWASRKALELDPDCAAAQAAHGFSLAMSGQVEEADKAFARAKELDPDLFEAHYMHARHAFACGRANEAVRSYEEAMRVRPDDYQSPLLMAQIYDDLARQEEAAAVRKRGIELALRRAETNPDDVRAFYMAANGLVALGERERGRRLAERALEIQPDDPMMLYNVGCIFSMLGLAERALDCLEKAAATGLAQKAWYERDSNLDPVRKHPRFQQLMRAL